MVGRDPLGPTSPGRAQSGPVPIILKIILWVWPTGDQTHDDLNELYTDVADELYGVPGFLAVGVLAVAWQTSWRGTLLLAGFS